MIFYLPKPNLVINSEHNHRSSDERFCHITTFLIMWQWPISNANIILRNHVSKTKHEMWTHWLSTSDHGTPRSTKSGKCWFHFSSPFCSSPSAPKKNGRFSKINELRFLIFSFKIDILILLKFLKCSKNLIWFDTFFSEIAYGRVSMWERTGKIDVM